MKPKIILCLALVLSGGLFGYSIARADDTNALASASAKQNQVSATVKTNWTDAKVTVYQVTGGAVQLDAKREVVTVCDGHYTNDLDVTAFVDPKTENAWVGLSYLDGPMFYLETKSNIISGTLQFLGSGFGDSQLDARGIIDDSEVFGEVIWNHSFVPSVKRGENVNAAIEQFNKNYDLKSVENVRTDVERTIVGQSLYRVENGFDPSLFLDDERGPQSRDATIEAIDASDGKLRLDLKSPTGSHKASVWIDLKSLKMVKAIQDGKVVSVELNTHPSALEFLQNKANGGNNDAMLLLSRLYGKNDVVLTEPIDPELLALFDWIKDRNLVPENSTKAEQWYKKWATSGNIQAIKTLGNTNLPWSGVVDPSTGLPMRQ